MSSDDLFTGRGRSHGQRQPGAASPALLLFLFLVCLLPTAQARIRFDVFLGYDGMIPEASWFPVLCEVNNDGPSFTAQVEIVPGQFNQGQERRMAVELPTGTTKRFVIPVFCSSRATTPASWDARLLDEKGRVRAESLGMRARKQFNWRIPLMGAVSRASIVMPSLSDTGRQQLDWQPSVARLQPNLFPDNPIALEGLTAIYLNSERALELKVNQVNALLAWLYQGGHLIVGVDQAMQINGNEWLRQLMPCEFKGMITCSQHTEVQEWLRSKRLHTGKEFPFADSSEIEAAPAASITPAPVPPRPARRTAVRSSPPPAALANPYARLLPDLEFEQTPVQTASCSLRDGTVLIGTPATPFAIIAHRGRGQITVLAASPELEPFLSWKNRPYFWAKIMGVPPELFSLQQLDHYNAVSIDGVLGSMIDTRQVRKLPVGWLLVLLVSYLLVIGPLDQYWLKKINRQMLTWLTFPAYVAGFSILIYLIGYKLRAGVVEWNELHLVDIVPTGERATLRGHTYATIYSPANARYKLACEQPFASLRGEYQRGQESSKAIVEQHGNNFAAEISVPVWTSQLYIGDWVRQDEPPLTFSLTSDDLHWYLKINNRLDKNVSQAHLVVGERVIPVPALPPNQVSQFTLARNSGMLLKSLVQQHGSMFRNVAVQRQQAFGANFRNYDVANSVIVSCFISQLNASQQTQPFQYGSSGFITMPGLDLSPLLERGDAILLAWVQDFSPVKPINKFSPRLGHRDTLLRITAEINPPKAEN